MKKILLFLFAAALVNTLHAQAVFCPPGAEWRYIFHDPFTPGSSAKITYDRDSMLGNMSVKVLNYTSFYKNNGGSYCYNVLIRQSGDTVFMNNCNTSGTWQILYNFAATAGQSWTTSVKDSSVYGSHTALTHTVNVLSVSTVTINNMSLKKLQVSYCYKLTGNPPVCDTTSIIERIGCTAYVFNYYNHPTVTDYSMLGEFLCYKDNSLGTATFSQKGCNYDVGINELAFNSSELFLYPQPADKLLHVELKDNSEGHYEVNIINTLGELVLTSKQEAAGSQLQLDLSQLPKGIYVIRISAGKKSANRKLIKE